ncbi:SDR family NAD(P)-dependent oxidoreductase [Fibrella aquatilis]|uniref:SDR family oxidoreductase n=1 Tax=Fibrella aquatilis TaxID=2817059 RepID=A0A939G1S3_9BACT|nr:SDR family NAD(P)-dependent oxidoreductase [Fibrella aquatilis]MBO0930286.1 SDR family oxidoreductase [Fibrella aquatilis]
MQNQIAIVTGAASGIGRAIAQRFIADGATVALLDLNAEAVTAEASQLGERAVSFPVDLTDEIAVHHVVADVLSRFGQIDVLVNAAGITGLTQTPTHLMPLENVRAVFELNFWGALYLTKAVLPAMLAQDYGRILHIASIAGKEGNPGMLGYSASKAALIGMTKAQGKEYAETGITVNAIAPAVIMTPLVEALPDAQVRYMTDRIPMRRCGTLTEVAHLAAFIVSRQNSFTTGFCYDLSGGRATY